MRKSIDPHYTQREIDLRFLGNDKQDSFSEESLVFYWWSFVFRERARPIIQQCILEAIKN